VARVVGTTHEHHRKDNRLEVASCVSFEGNIYQIVDIGFGGLGIGGSATSLASDSSNWIPCLMMSSTR
jgi:hypothetical protein